MLAICLSSKQNSSELLGGVSHYLLKESLLGKILPGVVVSQQIMTREYLFTVAPVLLILLIKFDVFLK